MISAQDEELHVPGSAAHWQESYYFNWADLDGGSFGLARIGFHDRGTRADGVLITMRDGKVEYVYPAIGVKAAPGQSARTGLRAGGLAFTMREPQRRWDITLDAGAKVDLAWEATTPVHDFHQGGQLGDVAAEHFEQAGKVSGTFSHNGVDREISGFGHRDKSWGVRNWAGIRGWEWISAQFGAGFAFNVTIGVVDGKPVHNGFVHRDGVNRALVRATVDYQWSRRKHVPVGARIDFTDTEGETYRVTAAALAQVPLVKKGLFIQETHASFGVVVDGAPLRGIGVMEHAWHAGLVRSVARLGQLAPVLALAVRGRRA
ncbi:hypothetical protein SAMN05192558_105335 [Actinokineospora alba]|uniref:Hydroxyneurosporene synthase (CrtC) n=1 Tax=Actinokineospora alba TaxID=504798 RepID=A0A1H0NG05_9PSEU|nr:hypothetical protein [Actinokineospora alba]TDP68705.1 hypothetical protein C8E96_4270 [Actinokineospora alba]SDH84909.1 hypothetical protein SAMN05421871_102385 [Actinokineospora alba]SDO91548.1 hypothetical protein SAMN05192558_105335 [Actinokineospora alba]